MKTMKRILGVFLSAILMLAGGMSVAAAEPTQQTYSIKINNAKTGHTYEAYQVFAGRLETVNDKKVLSDIQWGEGVRENKLLEELKNNELFIDCKSAAEVADKLNNQGKDSEVAKNFAKIVGKCLNGERETSTICINGTYTITVSKPGYYLIKDGDGSLNGQEGEVYTDFIMQVVDNVEVTPKGNVPTVVKKVKENSTGEWQDAADYSISDKVPFKLVGTLPNNYASYETYSYTFHDTLSSGLTLNKGSVKVFVKNTTEPLKVLDSKYYTIPENPTDSNCSFEVKLKNLKDITDINENSEIIVEYEAQLSEYAVIAGSGNENKVYLEFSNNPNGGGTGKTPEDKVVVFTYELVVNKIDEDKSPLTGAKFKLSKWSGNNWVVVKEYNEGTIDQFEFIALDAGKYNLEETEAPAGYNSIEPIVFTIVSQYNTDALEPQLIKLEIKDEEGNIISGNEKLFQVVLKPKDDESNIVTDVINKKGAVLPETGGIGTKIFYVTGCVLMIGAAIVLFRKMSRKDK